MYFMYVDESGDPGKMTDNDQTATRYFILSGVIVPIHHWRNYLSAFVEIRRYVKDQYGIGMRIELKGATLINPRGDPIYKNLSRDKRIMLYRDVLKMITTRLPEIRIFHIHLDKQFPRHPNALAGKDTEELMWTWLLQRFENFLKRSNRACGLVFADQMNEIKIRRTLRRMRVFNNIPSQYGGYYQAPIIQIVEDPVMRDSRHSFFIQIADLAAHALYRKLYPKGGYRKFNVDRLIEELSPLFLQEAVRDDPFKMGVKHL